MNIPTRRWRGYHRALKRNEPWAIKFSKLSPISQIFTWSYREDILKDLLYSTNPFLSMISKQSDGWASSYHQPVILGLEHGITFEQPEKDKDEPVE